MLFVVSTGNTVDYIDLKDRQNKTLQVSSWRVMYKDNNTNYKNYSNIKDTKPMINPNRIERPTKIASNFQTNLKT